jgi:vacuolar-type H+-ATPase subunit H
MIASARALPLSSSVKLDNKDEILELLREASERLPEELRQARWMLKEREEYLAATQRKADELVESARSEAQRLVQRTEIVKEAQAQARHMVEEARDQARQLRLEADDWADQQLAKFEIILERTLKMVTAGRQKLSGLPDKDEDAPGNPFESLGRPAGSGEGMTGVSGLDKRRSGPRPVTRPGEGTSGGTGAGGPAALRVSSRGGTTGAGGAGGGPFVPGNARPGALGPGNLGPVRRGPFGMGAPPDAPGNGQATEDSFFDQDSLE